MLIDKKSQAASLSTNLLLGTFRTGRTSGDTTDIDQPQLVMFNMGFFPILQQLSKGALIIALNQEINQRASIHFTSRLVTGERTVELKGPIYWCVLKTDRGARDLWTTDLPIKIIKRDENEQRKPPNAGHNVELDHI